MRHQTGPHRQTDRQTNTGQGRCEAGQVCMRDTQTGVRTGTSARTVQLCGGGGGKRCETQREREI